MDLEFNLRFTRDFDSHLDEINNSWVLIIRENIYLDFDLLYNTNFGLLVISILFESIHWSITWVMIFIDVEN